MSQGAIPDDVRAFVASHIASVAQLEVLLLLHANADRDWSPDALAGVMRMDRSWAAEQLGDLERVQLVRRNGDAFRFDAPPLVEALVDATARTFETRRVALVTLIATQPSRRIDSFSRAFRLRRPDDGG